MKQSKASIWDYDGEEKNSGDAGTVDLNVVTTAINPQLIYYIQVHWRLKSKTH